MTPFRKLLFWIGIRIVRSSSELFLPVVDFRNRRQLPHLYSVEFKRVTIFQKCCITHWGLGIRTSTVTETPFVIHLTYKFYPYNTDTETLPFVHISRPCMDIETPVIPISRLTRYPYKAGGLDIIRTNIETSSSMDTESASVSVVPISRPHCIIMKQITYFTSHTLF
jgi:hypothetical protein